MLRSKTGEVKTFKSQTEIALDDYAELISGKRPLPLYFPYTIDDCREESDWETFMQGPPDEDHTCWYNKRFSENINLGNSIGMWKRAKGNAWTKLMRKTHSELIVKQEGKDVPNIVVERKDKDWNNRANGLLKRDLNESTSDSWKKKQEALYAMTPQSEVNFIKTKEVKFNPNEVWPMEGAKTYDDNSFMVSVKIDKETTRKIHTLAENQNFSFEAFTKLIIARNIEPLWQVHISTIGAVDESDEMKDLKEKLAQYEKIGKQFNELT